MSFGKIKGQLEPIEILKSAIENRRLAASYLFSGPEGVGKNLVAREFAKAVNCLGQQGLAPCDECASCRKVEAGNHPDVHFIPADLKMEGGDDEGDAIKIEHIRQLQGSIVMRPYEGNYKVFIIDNAHLLTPDASNAFLKTLEEPPANSLIILVTSRPQMLLSTIVSRCQRVRFSSLPKEDLARMLREEYGLDELLSHYLAFSCEGRLGRALRYKDMDVFNSKNAIIDHFVSGYKATAGESISKDKIRESVGVLASWLRDIYCLKAGMPHSQLINLDRKAQLIGDAGKYSTADLDGLFKLLCDTSLCLEQNVNPRLLLNNMRLAFNG